MARTKSDDGPHLVDRHVGKRVEARRKTLGYSQSQLGAALGLTFQQVQKYEKGANRISSSKLWEIAQFFKVEPSYFFEGLTAAAPGMAESDTVVFGHDFPVTRQSQEIVRLAPQLSLRQQKIALEMIREMLGDKAGPEQD
ncbi:MAG: helix-turn-helix domain-containing protein [Brevundimonas sp.]|uniref:helix-turn-helix domain-containing protein n=1 Tax=Brevundimonas sp. TaxID=1871086 RepID=UPI0039190433